MSDDVQPVEGQGDGEATGGLFDSYLQNVPEEGRETVASYLKDAEKNVNSRLQEAAELKKTWEPYEPIREALSRYTPEQASELFGWHQQVTSSDEAFHAWLSEATKEAGMTQEQEQTLEDAEIQGDLSREEIQKIIEEQAEARLAPLQEQMTQFQTEQAVAAEEQNIRTALDALQADSKVTLSEAQKAVVLDLGMNSSGDDWVKEGFDRFQEIYAEGQRAFVTDKAGQPQTPVTTGATEAFKPTTDWGEAASQLRERLRQAT